MLPLPRFLTPAPAFLAAALLLDAAPCFAAWPNGPAVGVPLTTAAGDQSYLRGRDDLMISDGAGGAFLVWHDLGVNSASEVGVFLQRVLADGSRPWGPNGVAICVLDSFQIYPALASDGAGGAIVAWLDGRGGTFDVFAQRVNASGTKLWAASGVPVSTAAGNQVVPTLVPDGAGGAIVAWHDFRGGAASDIYAQRINASGSALWTANGVALCTAASSQFEPRIVTDGAGGAIVAWWDDRSGNTDVYARRITGAGVPQWTANGVPLCTAVNAQREYRIVTDGAGGAIVAWTDERTGAGFSDIYAQRVTSTGTVSWAANGVAVCTAISSQDSPALAPDGSGGAVVAWSDGRNGPPDIYAQRLNGAGAAQWAANGVLLCGAAGSQRNASIVPDGGGGAIVTWGDERGGPSDVYARRIPGTGVPQWSADGVAVSTATGDQYEPLVVPSQFGGAIVAWQDFRSGNVDLYAQHVDPFGFVGDPPPPPPDIRPIIDGVVDVPGDQGGRVRVLWERSNLDAGPAWEVTSYTLWRRILTTAAPAAPGNDTAPSTAAGPGRLRVTRGADLQATYWEFIATVPARGAPGYALLVDTGSDSTSGSIPWNVFFVEAATPDSFYVSPVDSGYSVDNLSPSAPSAFTGTVAGGTTVLDWATNPEADLFGYRLHRGTSAAFVPGPGNLVASPTASGYTDGTTGQYYKLSAVDVHGNESPYTLLVPQGTTGVGDGVPHPLRLDLASANPARAQVLLHGALPVAGEVMLTVHDAAGRRVRVLEAGWRAAGEFAARWDGRTDAGRTAGSGIYLVRLVAGTGSATVRCVLLR